MSAYERFCIADPLFFETPQRSGDDFSVAPLPTGWSRTEIDDWLANVPPGQSPPLQGWKIHISATLENARRILAIVFDYCTARPVAFKFIRSERLLLLRNAKSAERSGAGKFITIYPSGDADFETILVELDVRLRGHDGPYILSDLRFGDGPLYVRYGAFFMRPGPDGAPASLLQDDTGRLVPDRREPTFHTPPWISLPEFLQPHLAARHRQTLADAPWRIERALHFSNAGGIYLGLDRQSGETVAIREARRHAGLTLDRKDAVARLEDEKAVLAALAGIPAVPAVRDEFAAGESRFLARDYVEGSTLDDEFKRRFPLTTHRPDAAVVESYAAWAVAIAGKVEDAIRPIHARGIVIGDINPANIILRPDGRVMFIDWEVARRSAATGNQALGTPGFVPPAGTAGMAIDRYALACLRLFLFLPLTRLFRLDGGSARRLGEEIVRLIPVPVAFVAEAVDVIEAATAKDRPAAAVAWPGPGAPISDWHSIRSRMAAAIASTASPDRHDRLFPGDTAQFEPGGATNLANGAAGVLYALHASGVDIPSAWIGWLIARTAEAKDSDPMGLYGGLIGAAYCLDRIGRRDEAHTIVARCLPRLASVGPASPLDLRDGLSGIGLGLFHMAVATGDANLWKMVWRIAEIVAAEMAAPSDAGGSTGLMRGASGPALFLLRLYEHAGDRQLLALAGKALRRDLQRCLRTRHGALHVDDSRRSLPYVGHGSVGIGLVLDDYLASDADADLAEAAASIGLAARSRFYIQGGLLAGTAGMVVYLSRRTAAATPRDDPEVATQLSNLGRHVLPYGKNVALAGEQLVRLSMDFATGTAGVMIAIGAALGETAAALPFLPMSRSAIYRVTK